MNFYILFSQSSGFLRFLNIYHFYHIRQYYQIAAFSRNKKIMYIYKLLLFVWLVLVAYLNHIVCDFVRTYKHINSLKKEATYSHFIRFFSEQQNCSNVTALWIMWLYIHKWTYPLFLLWMTYYDVRAAYVIFSYLF